MERAKTVWGRLARRALAGLAIAVFAASILAYLHTIGIDFGSTTKVALWLFGGVLALSLLEPLFWLISLLRRAPTDDIAAKGSS